MAASKFQQIGIWTIAITLTVGTIGSFMAIVLANENAKIDQAQQEQDYAEQLAEYERLQEEALAANEPLAGYEATAFDASAVTELQVEVLEQGNGAEVGATDTISASYFGWVSDGTIFDSTNSKDVDEAPREFSLSGVITGWTDGLSGQKVGSTVLLTIPAEQAYGATERPGIPANSPMKFVVIIRDIVTTE